MRILVVDDDVDYANFLAGSLRHAGHEIELLHSGFGVLPRVSGKRNAPDLVVLDYFMPGLGGEAVLELLSRSAESTQTPVILHSSLDGAVVEPALKNHPLAVFVQKTGRVRRLLDTVAFVSRARSEQQMRQLAS